MHAVDWLCAAPPRHMFWLERDLYLVPPPQDTEHAVQVPHCCQHEDGQFVHVALSLCELDPLHELVDPRVRERVLVPLVVHVPWQAPYWP